VLAGTNHDVRQELFAHGIKPPHVRYERSIEVALGKLRRSGLLSQELPPSVGRRGKAGDQGRSPA
jgi:hypothetical protein